ncbi:nucleotidyltransferase family protein [Pseudovibrio denitrificans]|uniref:nucleotidyltransferase family protein n=1 Tax=Pseudovibrio denitrificans TaxID=258256 RepID=UPI0039BF573D
MYSEYERPSSVVHFLKAAVSGRAESLDEYWATPEFRSFLASRDIDGLLPALNIENAPWSEIYSTVWTAQLSALKELLADFETAGIHALVFKGAELTQRFYPQTPLSFFVDVDVLVPIAQIQEVKRILYNQGFSQSFFDTNTYGLVPRSTRLVGEIEATHYELAPFCKLTSTKLPKSAYNVLEARQSHPAYAKNGEISIVLEIDVHHNVATDVAIEPIFSRAVPSTNFEALTFSNEDHIWINCSRFYNEQALHNKSSLRTYTYTAPLMTSNVNWDVILSTARELELSASLYYPLKFMEIISNVDVPTDVLNALAPQVTRHSRDFGWQLGPLLGFIEPFPVPSR